MNRRPRIAKGTARRIDRLARAAHRFHAFAHHPLCDEYAGEVFRFGRSTRVCRGCALAALGGVVGFAFSFTAPPTAVALSAVVVACLLLGASLARFPRGLRRSKLATRLLPAALLTFAICAPIMRRTPAAAAVSVLAMATFALAVALYRRRRPDRTPCASCPEANDKPACRGLIAIVRRERAFQRRASQLIQLSLRPVAR